MQKLYSYCFANIFASKLKFTHFLRISKLKFEI